MAAGQVAGWLLRAGTDQGKNGQEHASGSMPGQRRAQRAALLLKVPLLYLYLVAVPGRPSFGPGPEGCTNPIGSFGRLTRDGCPCWSGSTCLTMGV